MKRKWTILLVLCFAAALQAQVPEKMSYQAVIRNSGDELVKNTQVGMRISILQGSATGTAVYTETQTPTTNANGLVSIQFGGGAGFSAIDWSSGVYFLKTETDISGGTNYSITGTSQLLSVPYALYAKTAGTAGTAANQPPTCSITAPANNAMIPNIDNVQVAITANDADGSIAEVQLFVDNVFYSSKIASPYNFTVNSLPLGNHTLTALAKDEQGAAAFATVNITVVVPETDAEFCARMAAQGKTCGLITALDNLGNTRTVDCKKGNCTGTTTQCDGATNTCISTTTLPSNNLCEGAYELTLDVPVYGNTTYAQASYGSSFGSSSHCYTTAGNYNGAGRDLVYSYTPTSSSTYAVRVTSSFDAMLWMTTGTCGGNGSTCIDISDFVGANGTEQLTFSGIAGTTYYFYVDSYNSTVYGEFTIEIKTCPNMETNADFCARMAAQGKTCGWITAVDNCGFTRTVSCGTSNCTGGTSCGPDNTCGTPPPNNLCAGAIALTLGVPASGNTTHATASYGGTLSTTCRNAMGGYNINAAGREVVYSYTPAANGTFNVKVTPEKESHSVLLWINTGTCGGNGSTCAYAAMNITDGYVTGGVTQVAVDGVAGTTYNIYVDSYSTSSGTVTIMYYGAFTIEVSQ